MFCSDLEEPQNGPPKTSQSDLPGVNEFYQKGCQEKTSASTGGEMFSRSPAHWN